jgi:hypothetical protein
MAVAGAGHWLGMSENENELPPGIDLGEVARESPDESVALEQDSVAGEPGWDAVQEDQGETVPEDDAQ